MCTHTSWGQLLICGRFKKNQEDKICKFSTIKRISDLVKDKKRLKDRCGMLIANECYIFENYKCCMLVDASDDN